MPARQKIAMLLLCILLYLADNSIAAETKEITPSDAFAAADLAERNLDVLLDVKGIKEVRLLKKIESGLNPMHPYQVIVASVETLIVLQKKENLRPMPRIVSSPMSYVPEDVRNLGQMLVREIQRISDIRGIKNYPNDLRQFQGKVPADVFGKHLDVFIKLRILADMEEISPNEVFSQLVRATSDVRSVLTQIDSAQRFRIDAPKDSPADNKPAHTFEICLQIRREINTLRQQFGLSPVPVPELAKDDAVTPADVFVQSMIIIAELNLLKMATGTISSTPLAIPVSGKTPADNYRQAVMVKYLLSQIRPLQDMMKQLGK